METPARMAAAARSTATGIRSPVEFAGPYNGAQCGLAWRNDGTHGSPHWVAQQGPVKAVVWGYKGAWAWVVYQGGRKIACGPRDRRYARPGLPRATGGYVRACNARRGVERWLARQGEADHV